jgi:hypothetical protein
MVVGPSCAGEVTLVVENNRWTLGRGDTETEGSCKLLGIGRHFGLEKDFDGS